MTTSIMVGLDEALLSRALRFVSPRDIEQWINQLIADRLSELEHEEAEAHLREGYIARHQESQETHEDWQVIDGEGWPA